MNGACRPNFNSDQSRLERWLSKELQIIREPQGDELEVISRIVSSVRSAGLLGDRRPTMNRLGQLTLTEEERSQDIRVFVGSAAEHLWQEIRLVPRLFCHESLYTCIRTCPSARTSMIWLSRLH